MCFGDTALEMALALLDDGIPEEAIPVALAPYVPEAMELDLPFSVAE